MLSVAHCAFADYHRLGPLEVEVKKRVVKERVKKAKQKVHDNVKVAQVRWIASLSLLQLICP